MELHVKPTEAELEILRVLWRHGPSTVKFVNELLNQDRPVGYTTTLKFMQIMHEKGYLRRDASEKTHVYQAAITEQETQQSLLNRLLDTAFQGSASRLVMQALGSRPSSSEELDEIRRFLDQLAGNPPAQDPNT
jgi:predicted transcriptional regulator